MRNSEKFHTMLVHGITKITTKQIPWWVRKYQRTFNNSSGCSNSRQQRRPMKCLHINRAEHREREKERGRASVCWLMYFGSWGGYHQLCCIWSQTCCLMHMNTHFKHIQTLPVSLSWLSTWTAAASADPAWVRVQWMLWIKLISILLHNVCVCVCVHRGCNKALPCVSVWTCFWFSQTVWPAGTRPYQRLLNTAYTILKMKVLFTMVNLSKSYYLLSRGLLSGTKL